MSARLRALRPTVCRCGHDPESHERYRPGSGCGWCGDDVCRRFRRAWLRPRPPAVDLAAACRDDEVIDAVLADDIDRALQIAEQPRFVALLVALRDAGRAAA